METERIAMQFKARARSAPGRLLEHPLDGGGRLTLRCAAGVWEMGVWRAGQAPSEREVNRWREAFHVPPNPIGQGYMTADGWCGYGYLWRGPDAPSGRDADGGEYGRTRSTGRYRVRAQAGTGRRARARLAG